MSNEVAAALDFMRDEWRRVPVMPSEEYYQRAEKSILGRASELFGRDAAIEAWAIFRPRYVVALDEIEVTPEMMEAGAEVMCGYSWENESEQEGAKRVYLAMRQLEPRRPDGGGPTTP